MIYGEKRSDQEKSNVPFLGYYDILKEDYHFYENDLNPLNVIIGHPVWLNDTELIYTVKTDNIIRKYNIETKVLENFSINPLGVGRYIIQYTPNDIFTILNGEIKTMNLHTKIWVDSDAKDINWYHTNLAYDEKTNKLYFVGQNVSNSLYERKIIEWDLTTDTTKIFYKLPFTSYGPGIIVIHEGYLIATGSYLPAIYCKVQRDKDRSMGSNFAINLKTKKSYILKDWKIPTAHNIWGKFGNMIYTPATFSQADNNLWSNKNNIDYIYPLFKKIDGKKDDYITDGIFVNLTSGLFIKNYNYAIKKKRRE